MTTKRQPATKKPLRVGDTLMVTNNLGLKIESLVAPSPNNRCRGCVLESASYAYCMSLGFGSAGTYGHGDDEIGVGCQGIIFIKHTAENRVRVAAELLVPGSEFPSEQPDEQRETP